MELIDLFIVGLFRIWGPYARYGSFNGFGILLHAQLSYWGPGTQLFDFLFFFEFVMCIAYMGSLLLQSQVLQPVSRKWLGP